MSPLSFLKNVVLAVTGDTEPHEMAAAVALGMMIALVPKGNLIAQVLILLAFLLDVNTALTGLAAIVLWAVTPLSDLVADRIGYALLVQAHGLKPLWTWLYNMPLAPWTAFNNTLVLGSFVLGLFLYIPVYFAAKRGLAWYQVHVQPHVLKWKVVQALKASGWIGGFTR